MVSKVYIVHTVYRAGVGVLQGFGFGVCRL